MGVKEFKVLLRALFYVFFMMLSIELRNNYPAIWDMLVYALLLLFPVILPYLIKVDERATSILVWGLSITLVLLWFFFIAWLMWIQAEQTLYFIRSFLYGSLLLSSPALLLLMITVGNEANKTAEDYDPAVTYAALFFMLVWIAGAYFFFIKHGTPIVFPSKIVH